MKLDELDRKLCKLLQVWFQGQCKRASLLHSFDKNSCPMTGNRKLEEAGWSRRIRGCSGAVHASFLHGRILFRVILESPRNWESIESFSRGSSRFSWSEGVLPWWGVASEFFIKLIVERTWTTLPPIFLGKLAARPIFPQIQSSPSVLHEIKKTHCVPIY